MEWNHIAAKWGEMTRRLQSQAHLDATGAVRTHEPVPPAGARAREHHMAATPVPDHLTGA